MTENSNSADRDIPPEKPDASSLQDTGLPRALSNSDDPFASKRADIDQRLAKFLEGVDVWAKRDELSDDVLFALDIDDTVARLNDFMTGARQLWKAADDARAAEKEPHLRAGREVDDSWRPILSRLEKVGEIGKRLFARLMGRKKELALIERKAAEKAAREAEEARRAAEADAALAATASQRIEAEERAADAERRANEAMQQAARASEPVRAGSATGRANRRSLQTKRTPVIVSMAQALSHYRREPELVELIKKFAARDLRESPTRRGVKTIPNIPGIGWKVDEEIA